ncbi:MAG TPA: YfiR family protein [Burkholderiaceae bacterium]|nr:YfiR family protein [Burkholderiaceae bacterium]
MTLLAIRGLAVVRNACATLLLALVPLLSTPSHAQVTSDAQTNERSVMAAYIYRFITYVEWPVSAFPSVDAPIIIGVVNADDIAAELEQIVQGRTAQSRRLQVRRIAPGEAATGVNVLFIGGEASKVLQAAKTLTDRSVLTITERGIDQGSVINFVHVDGRVRFEVNVGVAEKSGLRLSSRLLTVATRVKAG